MSKLLIQKTKDKIAWVFPGQGSQKLSQGLSLLPYSFARARFQQARQILGWSVLEVCQNQEQLSSTLYAQPCLYVVETLLADLIRRQGYRPDLVAGYSLGEYAAIYTAGALDFETGLQLVKRRAELMNHAPKGRMVALIKFEPAQLERQILHTPNVWRVNDDLEIAIISGTSQAIQSLLAKVEPKGVISLNVNVAFHTPLMLAAAAEFQRILDSTSFNSLKIPLLSSTELFPTIEIAQLKKGLIKQISQPVKWREISLSIASQGIKEVVEIGLGKDLIRQMKHICPALALTNVSKISREKNRKRCINTLLVS